MAHRAAICTVSLGRSSAGHALPHKLDMAQKYGFQGIEIFYEDLVHLAKSMPGGDSAENQLQAAKRIRQMCDSRSLVVIALQPFMHYEGLMNRNLHLERVAEMHHFVKLAQVLRTDLILLPSTFLPPEQVTEDMELIVEDMKEIAEIGLRETPVIRFAYEALCWGTRVDTWEASWDVVLRVNSPNFGLCLDTFNITGRIFADPAAVSGHEVNCRGVFAASLETLLATLDMSKCFLVQIADAQRLRKPLDMLHPFYNPQQPARMSWSRNARLFYGEMELGGYLPVRAILDVLIHRLGFKGWLSFEVFNIRLLDTDKVVPEEMAQRAMKSWSRMERDLELQVHDPLHWRQPVPHM